MRAKKTSFFISCFALISCSNIQNESVFYLEDYFENNLSLETVRQKLEECVVPELPSFVHDQYGGAQSAYLGYYHDYALFAGPSFGFSSQNYSLNQFCFNRLIFCMTKDDNDEIDYDSFLANNNYQRLESLFANGLLDSSVIENVYYTFIKKFVSEDVASVAYTNQITPRFNACYRQNNVINDIQIMEYMLVEYSKSPLNLKDIYGNDITISIDSVALGNYGGYDAYFFTSNNEIGRASFSESLNTYFRNRFYFGEDVKTKSSLFFVKDNIFYDYDYSQNLYFNNILGDNHIEIMARKVYSYYFNQANSRQDFKEDYISKWNENYKNPQFICSIA